MGYPVTTVLRIVGVLEATYYARKKREKEGSKPQVFNGGRPLPGYSKTNDDKRISDEQIKEWLLELVASDGQANGYRKLTVALQREHDLVINKKKVYRLCEELDLLRPQRQKKFKHPAKSQPPVKLQVRINFGKWTLSMATSKARADSSSFSR